MKALLGRFAAAHPNHVRIVTGAAVIGVLTLVAKLFAAGREMAIAWRFGVGPTADAYQLALTVTTWLPMMLANVSTAVLVPRLVSLRSKEKERLQFLAELNGTALICAIAVGLLNWLAAPAATQSLGGTIGSHTIQVATEIARALSPVAFFSICIFYLSARLQALERFTYSVTEAIPALTIALAVIGPVALGGADRLIWGTLAGFGLQLLVLIMLVHVHDGLGGFRLRHHSLHWRTLYGSLALMAAGQAILAFSIPIDQAFAARAGPGSVATLAYANRILLLLSTLGTVVLGRALLPVLSDAFARGDVVLARRHARQWSILLFLGALVASAAIWALAPMLIRLLFERGAFDVRASADVAQVFRVGLLQLPFYFGGIALVQWYAAAGLYREILTINVIALCVKIPLNVVLTESLGLSGILAATAGMYAVSATLLLLLSGRGQRLGAVRVFGEEPR
jgi:peptidoglycan biosynthesis protein MviN/MurJ (putative lipid II flippase)